MVAVVLVVAVVQAVKVTLLVLAALDLYVRPAALVVLLEALLLLELGLEHPQVQVLVAAVLVAVVEKVRAVIAVMAIAVAAVLADINHAVVLQGVAKVRPHSLLALQAHTVAAAVAAVMAILAQLAAVELEFYWGKAVAALAVQAAPHGVKVALVVALLAPLVPELTVVYLAVAALVLYITPALMRVARVREAQYVLSGPAIPVRIHQLVLDHHNA